MPNPIKVSPEIVKAYQDEVAKNSSEATARRKSISLKKFFKWAEGSNKIDVSPLATGASEKPFTTISPKGKVGFKTWGILGVTVGIAVLAFLFVSKIKLPIPFKINFAQESNLQTITNQTGTPAPNPISANSAVIAGWNLFTKLRFVSTDGTPEIGSQSVSFKIYNSDTGGSPLYSSQPQTISPDTNGVALISLESVPTDLFFQNEKLFIEPEIGSSSGSLRIPVPTANTATNLNGYPAANPETGAEALTIPVIDSTGSLSLAGQSPAVRAKEGNLLVEGQAVTIKTADGSGGNIEINPDANGYAHFLFEGSTGNFLNAQGPNLTKGSLYYGMVPNNATGYDLIKLQSGAPKMTTRFYVDALGNTYTSGNMLVGDNLAVTNTVYDNGYVQSSGNFSITQGAANYASIVKNATALSDVLDLTLNESGIAGSHYSTLTLNRYGGDINSRALTVNGNSEFNGQLKLGNFAANPLSIGTGSMVYNTSDNQVYVWTGAAWTAVGAGSNPPFSAITSGTNTTAAMVVGTGASLTFSGTGTITASDVTCTGCVSNTELANSSITFAGDTGSQAISLGSTENINGSSTITTDQTGASLTIAVAPNSLDFTEFKNSMTLDAATNIATGGLMLSTSGTGALNFGSTGQVTFAGNVDATNGLDVTGANLTVGATNFTVDQSNGNVVTAGTLTLPNGNTLTGIAGYTQFSAGVTGTSIATSGTDRISSTGNLVNIGSTQFNGVTYNWPGSVTSAGFILQVSGSGPYSLNWVDPAVAVASSIYWTSAQGALFPKNNTLDVLIGSDATTSARFAFTGVNAGGLPTASIAGSSVGISTYLTGDGNLATTNQQNLTLGGADTGSIILNSDGNNALTATGANLTTTGTLTFPNSNTLTGVSVSYLQFSSGLSVGGATTYYFDNAGNLNANSILTGGTQRISSGGNLTSIGTTEFNGSTYTWPGIGTQSNGFVLSTNGVGTLSWSDPNSLVAATQYWNQAAGALFPKNNTVDVLIGASSTASAKFAFTGVNTGGTPTASIAGATNVATFIDGNGNISTTNRNNLTLGNSATYNSTGDILLNPFGVGRVGVGTGSPTSTFDVTDASTTNGNVVNATASGITTGNILNLAEGGDQFFSGNVIQADIDNSGGGGGTFTGNFLNFLKAGTLVFKVDNGGNIATAGDAAINGGDITTTATTFNLLAGATTTLNIGPTIGGTMNLSGGSGAAGCTLDGTTGNFTCSGDITSTATTGTQGFWTQNLGALYPTNNTVDVLIGANATSSAKFAFMNVNSANAAIASISGSTNNPSDSLFLDGAGNISTTNRQNLTLGNSSTYDLTGNILLSPNGTGFVGIGTPTPTEAVTIYSPNNYRRLLVKSNAGGAFLDLDKKATNNAALIEFLTNGIGKWYVGTPDSDLLGNGDEFMIGRTNSSADIFIESNGTVGVATTTPTAQLDVNGTASVSGTLAFHAGTGTIQTTNTSDLVLGGNTSGNITLSPSNNTGNVVPGANNAINLGTSSSLQFKTIWGQTIYQNGNQVCDFSGTGCPPGAAQYWQLNSLVLSPTNSAAYDLAIGGTATGSAPFQVFAANGNMTTAGDIAVNGGDITTTATTFNLLAGATTQLNIGPASNVGEINLSGGSGDTGCTLDGTTGNFTCSGNIIGSGDSQGFWTQALGGLYPSNNTVDLLIGANSTASAKFAFTGVNAGGTPTASIAGATNVALFMDGNGNISTTNRQDLTLGNSATYNSTGNILLNPNAVGKVGIGTASPSTIIQIGDGTNAAIQTFTDGNGGLQTTIDFQTAGSSAPNSAAGWKTRLWGSGTYEGSDYGIGINTNTLWLNTGGTDISFYDSGVQVATIQNGNLGINTTAPTAFLDVNGAASVSGTLAFHAGTGTIQTTDTSPLVLGGDTTGNITLNPSNAAAGGYVAPASDNVTDLGLAATKFRNIYATNFYQGVGNNPVCDSSGANCPASTFYWTQNAGALYPSNNTVDVLFGSSATSSAKFAFKNVLTGVPTASISGNVANVATFIDGNGNISSTNRNNLTLGNSSTYNTTGNIFMNPNGTGGVGIGTTSLAAYQKFNITSTTTDPASQANPIYLQSSFNAVSGANAQLNRGFYSLTFAGGSQNYTNSVRAISGEAYNNGSGNITDLSGLVFAVGALSSGNITTANLIRVATFASGSPTGTIGTVKGLSIANLSAYNSPTTQVGVDIDANTGAVGTSKYGIRIGNVSGAGTNNYAIFTNAGLNRLGDQLSIVGSQDIQQLIVKGNGTQTSNLAEFQNSSSTPLVSIDNSGDINAAGYASISGTLTFKAGASSIQTTNTSDLTLGGNTSGNIILSPSNSAGNVVPGANNAINLGTSSSLQFKTIWGQTIYQNGNQVCDFSGTGCPPGAAQYWQLNSLVLSPTNAAAYDLAIGGETTASAKFQVFAADGSATMSGVLTVGNGTTNTIRSPYGPLSLAYKSAPNAWTNGLTLSDISGNVTIANDLAVNGGDLTTSATSFNLLAGATTLLSIGPGGAAGQIDFSGGSGATGCTLDGTTGNFTCSGNIIGSGATQGFWTQALGALYPTNNTVDVLIGADSTTSAKFAFTGVNTGGTPTASISGATNVATFIDGNGNISTTNRNNLTLGNSATYNSTGNILLNPNGTGNIGVGMPSPNFTLDVNGSVNIPNSGYYRAIDAGSVSRSVIGFGSGSILHVGSGGLASDMDFLVGSATPRMTIKNGGNIGIGTITPTSLLDVNGTASVSGTLAFHTGTGTIQTTNTSNLVLGGLTTGNIVLSPSNDTAGGYMAPNVDNVTDLGLAATKFRNIYATNFYQGAGNNAVCDSSGANCPSATFFWNESAGALYPSNNTVDVLIGSNATTSAKFAFTGVNTGGTPTASIAGTAASSDALFLDGNGNISTTNRQNLVLGNSATYNSTGDILLNPNGTGNVGIGTTSPQTKLQIGGSTADVGNIILLGKQTAASESLFPSIQQASVINAGVGQDLALGARSSNGGVIIYTGANTVQTGTFGVSSNAARLVVNAAGSVGIGGAITPSSFSGAKLYVASTGNVGVGTISPTALLDVAGAASISGTLTFRAGAGTIQTTTMSDLTLGGNTTGNLFLQPDGSTITGTVQIGAGGGGSTTPDLLVLDIKSDAGDPTGTNGAMYYNANTNKMRCYQNGSWADCGSGSGSSNWTLDAANGVLYPISQTVDVLIGGTSTASAKFAFKGVDGGTPTASISGATNIATFIDGNGNISTTNRQNLVLGNSATYNSTGDILLNPNGTGNVGIGTTTPRRPLDILNASSPQLRLTQADNTTYTDFQMNSSGDLVMNVDGVTNQLVLDNGGNVGIGTAAPSYTLDTTGSIRGTTFVRGDSVVIGGNDGISNCNDFADGICGNSNLWLQTPGNIYLVPNTSGTASGNSGGVSVGSSFASSKGFFQIDGHFGGNAVLTVKPDSGTYDVIAASSSAGLNIFQLQNSGNISALGALQIGAATNSVAYSRFGTDVTGHGLSNAYDLLVKGKLELNDTVYLDSGLLDNSAGDTVISLTSTPTTGENLLTSGTWQIKNPSSGNVGEAALIVDQEKAGDLFTASASGATKFLIANNGDTTVGAGGGGKITVGTVDPAYTINGQKYATYLPGMTGVKEETTGFVTTDEYVPGKGYRQIIDFNSQPQGSDLWLFAKSTMISGNMDSLVALLSPESETKAWYEVDKVNKKLVIYSSRPTTISYRLTAPRFDSANWGNLRNSDVSGFVLNVPDELNTGLDTIVQTLSDYTIGAVNGIYNLRDPAGHVVDGIEAIGNFVAANIKAGAIQTQEIATNSLTAFQGTVDNMLVRSGLVAANIQTQLISPIPGGKDVTVQIGSGTESGKLAIKNAGGTEVASIDDQGNATFSGTVKSQNIDDIQNLLTQVQADQTVLSQIVNSGVSTTSANLSQLITSDLFVTNQAAVNSLSVTQSLALGQNANFVIGSDGTINTLSGPLKLQSLAMGPIEVMAGLVTIDTHGNVNIAGDLNVAGKITTPELDAGVINTTGSATLSSVTTPELVVAAPDATIAGTIVNGVITTNSTVGTAVIQSGVSEITIRNPKVTDYSMVYVTPTSSTQNQVLYIKSKQAGGFVVGFDQPLPTDVSFNWWIVQVTQ